VGAVPGTGISNVESYPRPVPLAEELPPLTWWDSLPYQEVDGGNKMKPKSREEVLRYQQQLRRYDVYFICCAVFRKLLVLCFISETGIHYHIVVGLKYEILRIRPARTSK
jgi:hypothetical protein